MVHFAKAGELSQKYPSPSGKVFSYGTAGFRTLANDLDQVVYRIGYLAVLRSKFKRGATIGVMITASHNPEQDNGVKVIDPMGDMLEASWEPIATRLANVENSVLCDFLNQIISDEHIDMTFDGAVCVAEDTRPSSARLSAALMQGVNDASGQCKYYGIMTTPQLHFMVRCINSKEQYGIPTETGYYRKLSSAFKQLTENIPLPAGKYENKLRIDTANGVGAIAINGIKAYIGSSLLMSVNNDGSAGKLNYQCGADYVKVQQKAPTGQESVPGERCASFDGDADRIVYYYTDNSGNFNLMDGDKIATLVAGYLQELLVKADIKDLNLGLVQTAYANGSSTHYISNNLKVPVACVPTGVKYLHHKASDFDIGVYFEANGHGTVLFSERARSLIRQSTADERPASTSWESVKKLSHLIDLINETVGDALSDMLLVEYILRVRGWSIDDWNLCYTDLPNRQLKVTVKDRTIIQTYDAERKVSTPDGLQSAIDQIVKKFPSGRSFVRPSGTENVVRVYAEADTRDGADKLASEVSKLVFDMAGGVGDRPSSNM